MATYMVIERFRDGDASPSTRASASTAAWRPKGWSTSPSWVDEDLACCWQVMETDDPALLEEWMTQWRDLVDFEVYAVLGSAEAAERVLPTN